MVNQENPQPSDVLSPLSDALVRFDLSCWNLLAFLYELHSHTGNPDNLTNAIVAMKLSSATQPTTPPASTKELFARYKTYIERQLADAGIVLLVSIIECSLKDFCDALQGIVKLKLSWNDFGKTRALERFRTYFEKAAGVDLRIKEVNWQELRALVVLRNNIVHNLGELRDKDFVTIQPLLKKYSELGREGNRVTTTIECCQAMISSAHTVLGGAIIAITPEQVEHR